MRPGPSWGKKDKHFVTRVAESDREHGSYWDHVLIDAESRRAINCWSSAGERKRRLARPSPTSTGVRTAS